VKALADVEGGREPPRRSRSRSGPRAQGATAWRHGDQAGVVRGAAEVVAPSVIVAGSTNVRRDGPSESKRVVDDDRLDPGERRPQSREVLVVVEGVAAAPVDEPDLGIGEPPAVELERLARMQQHVREPGERDERVDRVAPLRQRRRTHAERRPGRCTRAMVSPGGRQPPSGA